MEKLLESRKRKKEEKQDVKKKFKSNFSSLRLIKDTTVNLPKEEEKTEDIILKTNTCNKESKFNGVVGERRKYTIEELGIEKIKWSMLSNYVVQNDSFEKILVKPINSLNPPREEDCNYSFEEYWKYYVNYINNLEDDWGTFLFFYKLVLCKSFSTCADLLVFNMNVQPIQTLSMLKRIIPGSSNYGVLTFIGAFEQHLNQRSLKTLKLLRENDRLCGILDCMDFTCWLYASFKCNGSFNFERPLKLLNQVLQRLFVAEIDKMKRNEIIGNFVKKSIHTKTPEDDEWILSNKDFFGLLMLKDLNILDFLKMTTNHFWLNDVKKISSALLKSFNIYCTKEDLEIVKVRDLPPKQDVKKRSGLIAWKIGNEKFVQNFYDNSYEYLNPGITNLIERDPQNLELSKVEILDKTPKEIEENINKIVLNAFNYIDTIKTTSALSAILHSTFKLKCDEVQPPEISNNFSKLGACSDLQSLQSLQSLQTGKIFIPSMLTIETMMKSAEYVHPQILVKILDSRCCGLVTVLLEKYGDGIFSRKFIINNLLEDVKNTSSEKHAQVTQNALFELLYKKEEEEVENVDNNSTDFSELTSFTKCKIGKSNNITSVVDFLKRVKLPEKFDIGSIPYNYLHKYLLFQCALLRIYEKYKSELNDRYGGTAFGKFLKNLKKVLRLLRTEYEYVPCISEKGSSLAEGFINWILDLKIIDSESFMRGKKYYVCSCYAMISYVIMGCFDKSTTMWLISYVKSLNFPGSFLKFALFVLGSSNSGKSQFFSDLKDVFNTGVNGDIHESALAGTKNNLMTEWIFLNLTLLAVGEEIDTISSTLFKKLVNNKTLFSRRKIFNDKFVDMINTSKIVILLNDMCRISKIDAGVLNRLKCLSYTHSFEEGSDFSKEFYIQMCKNEFPSENNFQNIKRGIFFIDKVFGENFKLLNDENPVKLQPTSQKMRNDTEEFKRHIDPLAKFIHQYEFVRNTTKRIHENEVRALMSEFLMNEREQPSKISHMMTRFLKKYNTDYNTRERKFNFILKSR